MRTDEVGRRLVGLLAARDGRGINYVERVARAFWLHDERID
jgi:hypothetical protein